MAGCIRSPPAAPNRLEKHVLPSCVHNCRMPLTVVPWFCWGTLVVCLGPGIVFEPGGRLVDTRAGRRCLGWGGPASPASREVRPGARSPAPPLQGYRGGRGAEEMRRGRRLWRASTPPPTRSASTCSRSVAGAAAGPWGEQGMHQRAVPHPRGWGRPLPLPHPGRASPGGAGRGGSFSTPCQRARLNSLFVPRGVRSALCMT